MKTADNSIALGGFTGFNGSAWVPVVVDGAAGFTYGYPNALAVVNNTLALGGAFVKPGGSMYSSFAFFDGNRYISPLNNTFDFDANVAALHVEEPGGRLYVGGGMGTTRPEGAHVGHFAWF
jgi:hypothetical protein